MTFDSGVKLMISFHNGVAEAVTFDGGVKLMIPFRNGIVVCTHRDDLWYGAPSDVTREWYWRRIS